MKERHWVLGWVILSIFLFSQCRNNQRQDSERHRTCECTMPEMPSESIRTESTFHVKNNDKIDWDAEGDVNVQLRNIINLEISANTNSEGRGIEVSRTNVITRIKNDYHSQLVDKTFSQNLARIYYCTFYNNLCKNLSISDQRLLELTQEELEKFKADMLKESSISKTPSVPKTQSVSPGYEKFPKKEIIRSTLNTKVTGPVKYLDSLFPIKNIIKSDSIYESTFTFIINHKIDINRLKICANDERIKLILVEYPGGYEQEYINKKQCFIMSRVKKGEYTARVFSDKKLDSNENKLQFIWNEIEI